MPYAHLALIRSVKIIMGFTIICIVKDGELVYNFPNLTDIQEQTRTELKKFDESHKVLTEAKPYPVEIHLALRK